MGRTARILQIGLISLGLFALAGATGCQPSETTSAANNGGNAGNGGQGGGQGGAGADGGGGQGGAGADGGGGNGQGGGPVDVCAEGANPTTVYAVNKGDIGQDIKVRLEGVIAMSHKHLISHSNSGSCLWGIFVSAPKTEDGQQLTETAPYSGAIVLSYGDTAPADTACPTGTDAIADDAAPGDVLDVVGTTSKFILNSCGNFASDTDVPQIQIFKTCQAKKTGTAAVPAPHVLTEAEITALATQKGGNATETHNMWGAVKLRAENVASDPWKGQNGNPDTIVGPFGKVKLAPGGLEVPDNLYYVQGSAEVCETAPKFDDMYDLPFTWDYVQGFHYLAFCTWSLANEDKCADYGPQSPDCAAASIDSCHAE